MQVDFNVPWEGKPVAPWNPFDLYYCYLEGRLWRYMELKDQWRAVLPDAWRYWHNVYWATDREDEGWA